METKLEECNALFSERARAVKHVARGLRTLRGASILMFRM